MAALSLIRLWLLSTVLGLSAQADRPKPGEVFIHKITYQGSGCPMGSVADLVASDSQAFTLLFDSFVVEVGPGIEAKKAKKQCRVEVDLRYPPGWTYTVADADFRGYARIEPGAVGEQRSNLYFNGKGPKLATDYLGPYDNDYLVSNKVGGGEQRWASCLTAETLTIDTVLLVKTKGGPNARARAMMTTDSVDGRLKHKYRLKWRKCRP